MTFLTTNRSVLRNHFSLAVPSRRPQHVIGWIAVAVLVVAIPLTAPDQLLRGLLATLPIAAAQGLMTIARTTGRSRLSAWAAWAAVAGLTGFSSIGTELTWIAFAVVAVLVTTAASEHGAGTGRLGLVGAALAGAAMLAAGAPPIAALAAVAACEVLTFTVGRLRSRLDLAHAALDSAEQRFRQLIDNSPHPIFVCDLQGWVTATNPAFTHTFGQVPARPGDVTWTGISDATEDVPSPAELAKQIGCGGVATLTGRRFRHRTGRQITADARVSVLREPRGRAVGLLVQLDVGHHGILRLWSANSTATLVA